MQPGQDRGPGSALRSENRGRPLRFRHKDWVLYMRANTNI